MALQAEWELAGPNKVRAHYAIIATSDATTTGLLYNNTTGKTLTCTGARLISNAAYTGAATNYRSVEIQNRGTDGTGNDEVCNWDGDNGNDLVAYTPQAMTLTSTTANLEVADNETLTITFTEVGTGLGLGPGYVEIDLE